ncbi:MAG TPA: hypothetical protein VHR45_04125 [Thermoanaerobaculia bacterium]|nr:hypothetical protein [Thermoanaerobaculia bacterium]
MVVFDRGLGGDGWATFTELVSLADDGDLWLENNCRGVRNGLVAAPGGHLVAQYPPGILVLDALPFAAGRALDALLPDRVLRNGVELPPVGRVPRGVFFSAAAIVLARNLAVLLGLLWTALALRRLGFAERTVAAAAALALFAGPLVFYSLVGMTHAPGFALASLLLWLLVCQRADPRPALAAGAGLTLGSAVLVRYGAIALLPVAGLAVAGGGRRRLAFAGGFLLPLLALPLWWRALFGSWLPPPYGGQLTITAASPWNVLASPVHGLFLFHPALLLAAAGLAAQAAREIAGRALGWGTIGCGWLLAVALFHGWWSEWPNSGGFGQRFLIDALPACALGFAWFLAPPGRARRWAVGAAAAAGYLLFFAAVGGLAPAPPPYPWPLRLGDYAPLLRQPPRPADLGAAVLKASFLARQAAGRR